MDCNKEEALRAKQLAEKKMEIKDFSGALKIAVKAQQLYPELENISQLILVCEVHCSAEKKSYGTDKDWYGILKVEPNADDISIKKQYRKLALILHPDKNKFSGSTDAFKLIGEAQRVLLDREKRMIHDSRRRSYGNVSAASWIPKQPNRQSHVPQHHHPWNQTHPVNVTAARSGGFQFTHQRFPTATGHKSTFWTVCPFCAVRYQFYREDAVNKVIHCQNCKKSFTAYELNAHGAAAAPTTTQTQHSRFPTKPAEATKRTFTTTPVFEKKQTPKAPPKATPKAPPKAAPKAQGNVNRKRKRRIEESSESSDSSESSESEEDVDVPSESEENGVPKNVDKNGNNQYSSEPPRRSSRAKRNVSYKESMHDIDVDIDDDDDDDDDVTPSNPAEGVKDGDDFWKEEVTKVAEDKQTESDKKPHKDDKGGESANDDDVEEVEPAVFECPDPEFSDFDKYRKEDSFKTGQIWACYDTADAMPRFYALIKKVFDTGFKLQIQWLKPVPETDDEKKWVGADLPVSCGRFRPEKTDKTEDLLSFSHLVPWEGSQRAKIFTIIPRKGETWALFKNWSMNWHSAEDDDDRKYEYEFVEVLSDFNENEGARVAPLEKVKGFVCLFKQKEGGETVVTGSERYRFAHMVLSCRMSGEEREGVPKGSYELDPASLPESIFQ